MEYTTFYTVNAGQWQQRKFDFDGRSVTYLLSGDYRGWWVLGKRGEVAEITASGPRLEAIPDAGTGGSRLGYVNRIAQIGGVLYVCGYRRQVYARVGSTWQHIDAGIVAPSTEMGTSFEAIHGLSARDIYAVGGHGEIWHYDGSKWDQIDSPTSVHPTEVLCVTPELVYACGENGIVLRGAGTRWEVLRTEALEDLWGLAALKGTVYVAGVGGLGQVDGNDIVSVDTDLGRTVPDYRLRTAADVLWSIGTDDILRFDGTKWEEVISPDNQ